MAPEYRDMGEVSRKVDIFSLGILILEIVTGQDNSTKVDFIDHVRKSYNIWKLLFRISIFEKFTQRSLIAPKFNRYVNTAWKGHK